VGGIVVDGQVIGEGRGAADASPAIYRHAHKLGDIVRDPYR
jgi:hypothetical protein